MPSDPMTVPVPTHPIVAATDLGGVEVLKRGNLYLLTDQGGDVHPDARGLGLYELDTRVLSSAALRINGEHATVLRGPHDAAKANVVQLTNPELRRDPEDKVFDSERLARRSLSIARGRSLQDGLREELVVANHSATAQDILIELGLAADMADIFEIRGYRRPRRGELEPVALDGARATFVYRGVDGWRRTTTVDASEGGTYGRADEADFPGAVVILRWRCRLAPGESTSVSWTARTVLDPPDELPTDGGIEALSATAATVASVTTERDYEAARISSDNELLDRTVRRSIADLRLLVNDGPAPGERYLAAGIPWFTTLFGRDAILASIETLAFMPAFARETLDVLARLQSTVDDPWRDAEPGKILHELRVGEMARAGELPHAPYYGTVDATPLWLILLAETFAWTGDHELVDRLWPNAMAALRWIEESGDLDGDGFVEYQRRSERGLLNQGWKDSGDCLRYRDGTLAEGPIALTEVQGYVYAAWLGIARSARTRGEHALADELEAKAADLQARFDAAFWVPDLGFYAMGLDGRKRPIDGIGSNAGQALWSGIVPAERTAALADRLLQPDLFSGWGIRTYASGQPGFNPIGYHTGTVWPHDNALIAAGLKAAGESDAANLITTRLVESSQWFPDLRLPELFCGYDRAEVGVPVAYPVACSPQAWAAAAPLHLIRTMLGLRADAARRRLELDRPNLPDWIGKLTVEGLRVGDASVDLLVHRWRGRTSAELLNRTGELDVIIHA